MPLDLPRILRGAAAGAVAAGVWALQQPLDKRVFGCRFDDTEFLGKAVLGPGHPYWRPVGTAIHVANGAAFGAAYAALAPRMPFPSWSRGPAAALVENSVLWPLTAAADRLHPARDEMPTLFGNRAALAQATWRHVVFGVVLGELERRLNAPDPEPVPAFSHVVSTNGHGSREDAEIITGAAVAAAQARPEEPEAGLDDEL